MKRVLLLNCVCLLVAGILLSGTYAFGQQSVQYLGIEQGLSNNAVTSIYKDHHGFVWIGTYDGLNKYDGSTVKIFRNVWEDVGSLNDNHVNRLAGSGNHIFAGTLKGLVYFDYADSRFHPVYFKGSGSTAVQKIANNITALQTDNKGNVYAGTDYAGLFICRAGDSISKQIPLPNGDKTYSVQAFSIDDANYIWVFIRNIGLCKLNKQNSKIEIVSQGIQYANCILTDARHQVWIGTDNGLFAYNLTSRSLSKVTAAKLNNENIVDIKFSRSGELWLGTNGGGVNVLDTASHAVRYIVSGAGDNNNLHSDAISMVYQDNEQRMWIATLRGGVSFLDSRRNQFKLITHNPFNKNSVVNNFIISFCEDYLHNLWIGTDGGGLSYWNRKTNQFTNYVHNSDAASLRSNFVVSLVQDKKKQLWAAMFSGGIDRFDAQTQRFIHYDCYNSTTKAVDKNLWKLYLDSHNNLWAGTTRGGTLYKYNRKADKFEVFDNQLTNIHSIFEDRAGTLWAGDYSRLIKIDTANKRHQFITVKNAVRSITEDNERNLWVGTEGGGLLRYNIAAKTLKRFTRSDGLPSNSLLNVVVDGSGKLWASTYNGLTEYNAKNNTFKNFYASDGLQSNQFNFNAAVRLSSGELAFGGINGFNIFYPDSISLALHHPELKFTGLQINNKPIDGNVNYTDGNAVVDLKQITVPYNEATLAIDYTAPEYSFPDKLNYAYYLENWDHGWNYVGKIKTAYYSRLNEGKYILRVKATNSAGEWNGRQLTLQITVLPPWFRTWWAYLLYISALSAVIYWFWLYRIRQTKLKYEVEIANLKVEREKELNEKKLSFFTNISHEFRTPLTLIINPIKDLLQSDGNKHSDELNTIYRNARRLLGLVDHLLLFRKTESENDSLNVVNLNFAKLCNDVYACFLHQAKIKSIKYSYHSNVQEIIIAADREKIEIAIFNLISNAIKFTSIGGEIDITLEEKDKSVILKVEDNGCGIAPGIGEKLFDKFYQIKDNTSLKTGFGIGLYLSKSFINSHDGTISYTGNNRNGTTFTVSLPKKRLQESNPQPESIEPGQHLIDELITGDAVHERPAEEEVANFELLISDRQSILIIDDNEQLRDYIRKIFKEHYKTFEAKSAEEGLEMIKKHLPDLVVSDISMGALSGIDMCRIIKQDSSLSHIPVILLTGDGNPEVKLKGIEVGAIDFVTKPFEKDLLVARVQGILKDRRELQNYFYNEVTLKSTTRNISEDHKEFLYKCITIIENYLMEPNFDVKTIADEMGMSYSSLFKKIKSISGQSVNNFVRFVRLRKAAEMMINTNCNVNEAAFNTGFNDIKYFREQFIKMFGVKPSEFIKQHRQAFNKNYSVEQTFR
ncbi:hybrid sensor histidine kinase/response regulator transcription factor [Mucilaginibacter gilvus]|uniref:histidine kinase n=1 Tax=Mucilaginibacter gilvus TaxID=2305909 RepID=A0A3S3VQU8_9SPHI|nr:hybrid sensor histidine kinase/response regulator transcription factor [Mucilaginibacter gilvus]RWY53811.1 hybrid sensor histidine kinase/response regulator [Mucilaginibacter gilvus]